MARSRADSDGVGGAAAGCCVRLDRVPVNDRKKPTPVIQSVVTPARWNSITQAASCRKY